MKTQKIEDLKVGDRVDSTFMVLEKELRHSMKDPEREFLQIKLGDRTGTIRAKVFDRVREMSGLFEAGDILKISGTYVQQYPPPPSKGNLEIIIDPSNTEKVKHSEVSIEDYKRKTQKDVERMFDDMRMTVTGFKNMNLKLLMDSFFEDEDFTREFKLAPAAKIHHHPYIGGLIEHTYAVFTFCKCILAVYPDLDRELLLTGAILHDIGKLRDYKYKANIDITDFGGLVGHIIAGDEMLRDRIKKIENFPVELELKLRHMLLSHHNKGEWGSPVEPRFKEAIALHHADIADAHIAQAIEIEREERRKERRDSWSSFRRELNRMLYLGKPEEKK